MQNAKYSAKGFTLIELLLILAISGSILVGVLNVSMKKTDETRRDQTVLQMQQILNAATAYYLKHSNWPVQHQRTQLQDSELVTKPYIPAVMSNNPIAGTAGPYILNSNYTNDYFYVGTNVGLASTAAIVAGRLPLAFVTTANGLTHTPPTQTASCATATPDVGCTYVVASIPVPGQNLNNARAINYAGVYSNGACVPAPHCPPNMKPSIYVVPVAVTGNAATQHSCPSSSCVIDSYPLTNFSAFALGKDDAGNPDNNDPVGGARAPTLKNCHDANTTICDVPASEVALGTQYWRVCLSVNTQEGVVAPTDTDIGAKMGSVLAVTRCVPSAGAEIPSGTAFGIYTP